MLLSRVAEENAGDDLKLLVDGLNYAQKVARSLDLIAAAYEEYGDGLVVANSLGKDSCVVWDLAQRVNPKIRGFIVTTRFKPAETVAFMHERPRALLSCVCSRTTSRFPIGCTRATQTVVADCSRSSRRARLWRR